MKNYLLKIQYDGTAYHGWQKQSNTMNTIQQILEERLSRVLKEDIKIHGSGRTDAGVHAYGQTANFKCRSIDDLVDFLAKVNHILPIDIKIIGIREVKMQFHSRLSAKAKRYSYHINTAQRPSVFRRKYVFHYDMKLDVNLMKRAAQKLIGTHDFRAFSSEKDLSKSCVRDLYEITIEQKEHDITIYYYGNGFIYNMVRIITGTLLEIGTGKRRIENIDAAFETGKREYAGFMVLPHGLFLENVEYEEGIQT